MEFQADIFIKAKEIIKNYYKDELGKTLTFNDIYIVWWCKTLQNWKALLSTTISDTRYFEVTFNGDKNEIYVDSYIKEKNYCIKNEK